MAVGGAGVAVNVGLGVRVAAGFGVEVGGAGAAVGLGVRVAAGPGVAVGIGVRVREFSPLPGRYRIGLIIRRGGRKPSATALSSGVGSASGACACAALPHEANSAKPPTIAAQRKRRNVYDR